VEGGMGRLVLGLIIALVIIAAVLAPRLRSRSVKPGAGATAPDFTLPSEDGTLVRLSGYRGQWVILYFYPKDQTAGCTREARQFQADQPRYAQHQAVVLGVSLDSVASHQQFCAKQGLNFKLLADTDHQVTAAYGSLTNLGVVKFAARNTFLIDPAGKIAKVFTAVDPAAHSAEVLAELDRRQGGPRRMDPMPRE
jgi:thioredoxin-dependent peroxiredoxin